MTKEPYPQIQCSLSNNLLTHIHQFLHFPSLPFFPENPLVSFYLPPVYKPLDSNL